MRIQIMSDLHLEFPSATFDGLENAGADMLVLAGDITSLKDLERARDHLAWFCERWSKVVYVPGNHEFYGTTPTEALETLAAIEAELPNLNIPESNFVRATLWFQKHPDTTWLDETEISDFRVIRNFRPWVYEQGIFDETTILKYAVTGGIVVTHHLPSYLSVPDRYRGERSNRFFVHDMEEFILDRQPALWFHGHTHDRCDYTLENTRVVCNPRGYPGERQGSYEPVVLEISI